jgi:hypothetical protein
MDAGIHEALEIPTKCAAYDLDGRNLYNPIPTSWRKTGCLKVYDDIPLAILNH